VGDQIIFVTVLYQKKNNFLNSKINIFQKNNFNHIFNIFVNFIFYSIYNSDDDDRELQEESLQE
jgi:hypothetical protein